MENPGLNAWARGLAAATLVGSAGHWNGPAVQVLALASGITFFDLGRRDRVERAERPNENGATDTFAAEHYGVAMQLAFLAALTLGAWDNRAPEVAWRSPGLLGFVGFLVMMAGVGLRQSAAQALGRHFTVGLSILADHELVVTGPYRWLRHPNYAALLMVGLGTAMMMWSPHAAGMMLVGWLPLALMRIAAEERALVGRLGAAYADYTRHRWCLLPGLY